MNETPIEYSDKQMALINAAVKLFAEHGFDGTSVRDIAQEAGVNVAMISYYFGSKEKLMEAVFEQKSNDTRIKIENLLLNTQLSHTGKIYSLIDDYVEKFLNQKKFHKIMMCEQLKDKGTPIFELIYELKRRNLESIRKLINEGQKSGDFKKNIDIPLMMATLVGTVSQMIASERFYREFNNLQQLSEEEFKNHMRKKISTHLKHIFKLTLTNEA